MKAFAILSLKKERVQNRKKQHFCISYSTTKVVYNSSISLSGQRCI